MTLKHCVVLCACAPAIALESELALLTEAFENLAWKLSPIAVLKNLTIADVDQYPDSPIDITQLNPRPASRQDRLLQPYQYATNTWLVTVSRQSGTLCGFHATKNTTSLLSALLADSTKEAKDWLRRMLLPNFEIAFRNRMGEKCAAKIGDIESFFNNVAQSITPRPDLIMGKRVLDLIIADRSAVNALYLNSSFTNPATPFESIAIRKRFLNDVQVFKTDTGLQIYPMILLATTTTSGAASAHFVSLIAAHDGADQAAFLCDSLGSGNGYGIPEYASILASTLFNKS